MFKTLITLLTCLPLLLIADGQEPDIHKLSETFGNLIGRNLKGPGFSFDMDALIKGIQDGAAGKPAPLTDQEYEKGMAQLQEKLINAMAEENLQQAETFLKQNQSQTGVQTLESGKLEYKVDQQGNGAVVQAGATPLINYKGQLLDGTVFSSSDEMGPIAIDLSKTIPGFAKGIAGMKEGEKRTLFIHPDLAYGKQGQLPPNSLLIFEVEILKAEAPNGDESES